MCAAQQIRGLAELALGPARFGQRIQREIVIGKQAQRLVEKLAGRFDLLIDTISAPHDYNRYLGMLRPQGAMVIVGIPPEPIPVSAWSLIAGNRRLAGSAIGGIPETQEMLDYCARHEIGADVKVIPIDKVNEAYERMIRNDVRYRFVIDVASLE